MDIQWIRDGLGKPGKTQSGLAKAMGRYPSAVSMLLKGERSVKADEIHIIAKYLEVDPPDFDISSEDVAADLSARLAPKTVKLKGYVGAGSEAHFYKITDEDFEEVKAPPNATDRTVAVQIRGKSWGPAMDSWLVFYDDVRSPIDPSMHGKPCIVGLADDRILLKIPYPLRNGLFRLVSNSESEPAIEDAIVEWAALVTSMAPR